MSFNEVQEKVLQLESAIKRLDTVKKHLNRNASDIKAEIHASVSRNLECLRGREVSLLSQVDQVLRVKEETLHHQQARLNQTLGVLRTGLSMILDHTASERQLADTLEKLNRIELSPEETPFISFKADHVNLRESILNYGRVDASGLPLLTAFDDPGNPSTSLPRHVEEYEDVDHHIFYKTVEEVKRAKTSASGISVTIPKLRVEDWLQSKVPIAVVKSGAVDSSAKSMPATRPSTLAKSGGIPMNLPGNSTPGSSCSLNNWLSLIKQHADLEEEHDFEIVDNSSSLKAEPKTPRANCDIHSRPVKTELKDWLYCGTENTSQFTSNFFNHVPTDSKFWLAQACHHLTSLDDLKYKDFFQHVSKEPSTWLRSRAHGKLQQTSHDGREYGDLFSHISKDKENWLQKQTKIKETEEDKSAGINSSYRLIFVEKDNKKWLMCSARSTPSVELGDSCDTNEDCAGIMKCPSQPDSLKLCVREKLQVINSPELNLLPLSVQEWPALGSEDKTKCLSTVEDSSLLSHIHNTDSSMWLMNPPVPSSMDVSKSPSSPDKFKDDKEEANLWLQKTGTTNSPESASAEIISSSSPCADFCVSDWLLVPTKHKDSQSNEFDHNKESDS